MNNTMIYALRMFAYCCTSNGMGGSVIRSIDDLASFRRVNDRSHIVSVPH